MRVLVCERTTLTPRGKAGAGQAAAHQTRRSVLSHRLPSCFSISRRSHNSLRALRPLRSNKVRPVRQRGALKARCREIEKHEAPRNDALRPARPRLCVTGWRATAARHHLYSRQAVPGRGDFWLGCAVRPGAGRAESAHVSFSPALFERRALRGPQRVCRRRSQAEQRSGVTAIAVTETV
jgi:hypothetical protein